SIRLVRSRRSLQRKALLRIVGTGVAVGMHAAFHIAVRVLECCAIDRKARRQSEQLEVVARKIDHWRRGKQRGADREAAIIGTRSVLGSRGRATAALLDVERFAATA